MVAAMRCVRPQFQWYQLIYATEIKSIQLHDLDKCVLCQNVNSRVLQSPAISRRSSDGAGYNTLADKLLAFNKINCLPSSVVTRFIGSQYLEEFLKSHKPTWMSAVDCNIINPNSNDLRGRRHWRQKVLILPYIRNESTERMMVKWLCGVSGVGICTVFCG